MPNESPHRHLKEKLRQERAQLILDVTEEMLVEKGYHDTSMDEVATRTGIAKGTLYQHFPSKAESIFDPHISTAVMMVTFLSLLSLTQQEQLLAQEQLSSEKFIVQLEQAFFQGILVRS